MLQLGLGDQLLGRAAPHRATETRIQARRRGYVPKFTLDYFNPLVNVIPLFRKAASRYNHSNTTAICGANDFLSVNYLSGGHFGHNRP